VDDLLAGVIVEVEVCADEETLRLATEIYEGEVESGPAERAVIFGSVWVLLQELLDEGSVEELSAGLPALMSRVGALNYRCAILRQNRQALGFHITAARAAIENRRRRDVIIRGPQSGQTGDQSQDPGPADS